MNRREIMLVIMGAIEEWAEENEVELSASDWYELAERIYYAFIEKGLIAQDRVGG